MAIETLQMSDGRAIAYAHYGRLEGTPLFYFHGSPSSRLEGLSLDAAGKKYGYHIVAIDRPGIGHSGYQKNRKLLDVTTDVLALAQKLGWDKFGVVGLSGGGPQVLACAKKIPEKLLFAVDVSGSAPLYQGDLSKELGFLDRLYGTIAGVCPFIFKPTFALLGMLIKYSKPEKLRKLFKRSLCKADDQWLSVLGNATNFQLSMKEAFRQGAAGAAEDALMLYADWGFSLEEITFPITLYHGSADKFVPYSFAKYKEKHLSNPTLHTLNGKGHLTMCDEYDAILSGINVTRPEMA
jgi:pimeloyl-ACP methyl ester carboxylesterase